MATISSTLRVLLNTCECVFIEHKSKRYQLTNKREILRKVQSRWQFIYSEYNIKSGEVNSERIELFLDARRSVLYDTDRAIATIMFRGKVYEIVFKVTKGASPRDIHTARKAVKSENGGV